MHIDERAKAIKAARSRIADFLRMSDVLVPPAALKGMYADCLTALKKSQEDLASIISGEG